MQQRLPTNTRWSRPGAFNLSFFSRKVPVHLVSHLHAVFFPWRLKPRSLPLFLLPPFLRHLSSPVRPAARPAPNVQFTMYHVNIFCDSFSRFLVCRIFNVKPPFGHTFDRSESIYYIVLDKALGSQAIFFPPEGINIRSYPTHF